MISLAIFGIENSGVLAITALLTGVALVALAMWIAGLISPRSFNPQKGEAYECGIPTRGESMSQFHVGYYLFAILFLMFDVETVFLFPWAVRMQAWALRESSASPSFLVFWCWASYMPGGKELWNGSNNKKHALRGIQG